MNIWTRQNVCKAAFTKSIQCSPALQRDLLYMAEFVYIYIARHKLIFEGGTPLIYILSIYQVYITYLYYIRVGLNGANNN